ncbi:phosphoadenosine phosphosulfate reductase [Pseudohongiella acticola]|jgi:phosphoadenosine phosphosulfate reductase|uniref:Adenosine 5'-phosphosulfate reductase n=1 Tax=Pseudohongiella acticola TaxID=1524254 RepID=A0A1E8CHN9_9GAMM|nr:phosphoadenylyl-sulfate reductase [Pseudohongiella acticola]OFE11946.1 phosphoadenosine phosphosulfate reductase [Pseudohongiella acticola]
MISAHNIAEINEKFNTMEPRDILQQVLADVPNIVVSFSGAEDVALVAMAWKLKKNIKVFTLDTGRLHAETYQFIDKVRQEFDLDLDFLYPDTTAIQQLTSNKGLFSFYQDGHEECCSIRKTEPLRRQLANVDAWITGQRKDQSPTRTDVPLAQVDATFAAPGKTLLKFNPFANWRSKDVWDYIRMFDLPYNPLHDQGFVSIGCQPCTKPIGPNQHEREGRWWWEEATAKECGLHKINIIE